MFQPHEFCVNQFPVCVYIYKCLVTFHKLLLVLHCLFIYEHNHCFFQLIIKFYTNTCTYTCTHTMQENHIFLCCRLELNGHRRRLTWEAAPRSIHDGIQSAIASSDCLVFDTNIAQLFADHGNLGINVTITICDRQKDLPLEISCLCYLFLAPECSSKIDSSFSCHIHLVILLLTVDCRVL